NRSLDTSSHGRLFLYGTISSSAFRPHGPSRSPTLGTHQAHFRNEHRAPLSFLHRVGLPEFVAKERIAACDSFKRGLLLHHVFCGPCVLACRDSALLCDPPSFYINFSGPWDTPAV